jgi:hypothetical protein
MDGNLYGTISVEPEAGAMTSAPMSVDSILDVERIFPTLTAVALDVLFKP